MCPCLTIIEIGLIDLFNGNIFIMLKNGLFSRLDLNYGKENGNVEFRIISKNQMNIVNEVKCL